MKKPWRNYLIIPSMTLFVVIAGSWLLTPFVAKHYLVKYFASQGEEASISSLSVDFFPPKVTLKKLNVLSNKHQTLALNTLSIGIEAFPLFTKTIHFTNAEIDGLTLDVKQKENSWIIAGIDLSQYQATDNSSAKKESSQEKVVDTSTPWSVKLPTFRFTNSTVQLSRQLKEQANPQQDTLTLNTLAIDDLYGKGLNWNGTVSINALVNAAQLDIASKFDYSPNASTVSLTLNKNRIPIEDLSHFLPAPYNQGTGVLSVDGKLALSMKVNDKVSYFALNNSTLNIGAENLDLPLQKTMSAGTKNTTLKLSDVTATYNTNQVLDATGTLQASSQDSTFSQGQNKTTYQALDIYSAIDIKHQNNTNDLKSNKTDITLKGANVLQDGNTASLGNFQLTLNDLLATLSNDNQSIALKSGIQIKINELAAQLPEDQKAALKSASLSLPLTFSKDQSGLSVTLPKTDFSVNGLSLALTSLILENDSTSVQLNNLTAKQAPDKQVSLSADSTITSTNLSAQQADNKVNYQSLIWSNSLSATQNNDTISLKNALFDLAIKKLDVDKKGTIHSSLADAHITAKNINVDLDGDKAPKVAGTDINILTQGMDSKLTPNKRAASWESADIHDLSMTQQGDLFATELSKLSIKNLVLSAPINDKKSLPPLTTVGEIDVNTVKANQDGANIKSIMTKDVKGNVFLGKDRQIENLVFIDANKQTSPTAPSAQTSIPKSKDADNAIANTPNAAKAPAFKAPYYIILNAYDLTGKSSVYIEDNGVKPALKRTLDITKLSLRNLNTKDAKQATTLSIGVKNGKYTTLNGDVEIWPMADELTMKSELKVSQADLPPYSPYVASALGYQIDSGQLNLDLKLHANKGDINGNAHLVLKQFDLGGSYESSSAIKSGIIPLNLAVSALKDSDNNIDLDIPLSGNIDSPSFGWGDFLFIPVKKALFSASSTYLLQTFIPYANVITIARYAGDQLLKVRVEPLIYPPKETKIDDKQSTFLKQLVALMKDKKQSELKICGVASYLDLGLEKPPATINDKTREAANALADKRAQNLKDYLVSQNINSSRLFVCSPELDFSTKSQPRVDLNF